MTEGIDRELFAERAASVTRHLDRVAAHLPDDPSQLQPMTAATDTVILHLWQAVQIVIDLAVSGCVRLGLGSPPTYAEAFAPVEPSEVRRGRPSLSGGGTHSPQVTFRVPDQLHRQAVDAAEREGKTVSALARKALEQYLRQS